MYRPANFQTMRNVVESSAASGVPRKEIGSLVRPICWRTGPMGPIDGE